MSNRKLPFVSLASLALLAATVSVGCTSPSEEEAVHARIEVLGETASALAASAITVINGTYGGLCSGHVVGGTDTWTFDVATPANTTLSVRKNDSDCVLTIVNMVATGTYIASPAIALNTTNAYKATASAFAVSAGPTVFYGNAKIDALTFAANFTISILVSDAPTGSASADKAATFATQSATVTSGTVAASNYTISYAGFGLQKDVDNVVQSVSGYAQLTAGTATGQDYAVHVGELTGSSSIADIEAAYAAVPSDEKGLLSALTTLQLPASIYSLTSPTVDLDTATKRTVIIRNTDSAVTSYQLLLVTFIP